MKNLTYKPLAASSFIRSKMLVCPACDSEISDAQMIERKGYIGCINCVRWLK